MNWEQAARVLAAALAAIGDVVAAVRDDGVERSIATAKDALTAIGTIVSTVRAGKLEPADLSEVEADLQTLVRALAKNDDEADRALRAKFREGD